MSRQLRVLTWNVQGSQGLDVPAVAAVVNEANPDVIALQEVQRRQAARLAAALHLGGRRWVLKHWPVVHRAEGLAVLTPHRLVSADRFVLRPGWFWRWQRRVGLDVTIDVGGGTVRLLDVHLSPHDHRVQRRSEVDVIAARARRTPQLPIVVGDLNELPDEEAVAELVAAGWLDAWHERHGAEPGATNWTAGTRAGRPATQRIDYVFVPAGWVVTDAEVIEALDGGDSVESRDAMSRLSDHLPLVVTLRLPELP